MQSPLTDAEWRVLPVLVAGRIAVSLTVGAYSSAKDPGNEYLKLTQIPGWKALQDLRATPPERWTALLRDEGRAAL